MLSVPAMLLDLLLLTSSYLCVRLSPSLRLCGRVSHTLSSCRLSSSGNGSCNLRRVVRLYSTSMRDRTHDDDGVLHNDSDEDDDDCDDDTSERESGGRGSGRRRSKGKASRKFRQHVNPLAAAYQQPTLLDIDWIEKQ